MNNTNKVKMPSNGVTNERVHKSRQNTPIILNIPDWYEQSLEYNKINDIDIETGLITKIMLKLIIQKTIETTTNKTIIKSLFLTAMSILF